jgi:hypothetical protein
LFPCIVSSATRPASPSPEKLKKKIKKKKKEETPRNPPEKVANSGRSRRR